MALLFDLTYEDDISNWRKLKVLKYVAGQKYVEFEPNIPKEDYIHSGFEEVKIGIASERTQYLPNNIQEKRNQYGLIHNIKRKIHACQGDTLLSTKTEISHNNGNFNIWDKGKMIVILIHKKCSRDTIFVCDKKKLDALINPITGKTQWTDYMKEIISIITINLTTTYDLNTTE